MWIATVAYDVDHPSLDRQHFASLRDLSCGAVQKSLLRPRSTVSNVSGILVFGATSSSSHVRCWIDLIRSTPAETPVSAGVQTDSCILQRHEDREGRWQGTAAKSDGCHFLGIFTGRLGPPVHYWCFEETRNETNRLHTTSIMWMSQQLVPTSLSKSIAGILLGQSATSYKDQSPSVRLPVASPHRVVLMIRTASPPLSFFISA